MSKNYLNSDVDHFNSTKRLNNKPKLVILLIVLILLGLIFYVLLSVREKSQSSYDGIETKENRLDNDEYVKNMADNKGYLRKKSSSGSDDLENISEDDYKEIFTNAVSISSSNDNVDDNSGNINRDLIDKIDNSVSNSYPPIPVSSLDNDTAANVNVIDRASGNTAVKNLTAEQINAYKDNRLAELQNALKSPTKVYAYTADNRNVPDTASQEPLTYEEKLNMILNKTGSQHETPQNNQSGELLSGDYELQHRVQKARKGEIKTGFVIPATLLTEINSSISGTVIGQVRQNVFDTSTGQYLLIPQGTKIIGEYASDVPYGNKRLFMSWKRMVFPNGSSLDLDMMPGSDMTGRAGFEDKVNTHFWKIFGNALLFSLIIAGTNITTSETLMDYFLPVYARDTMSSMSDALALSLGETMSEMIKKNLNIAPEIDIRAGYLFNIMVTKDMILPTYEFQ